MGICPPNIQRNASRGNNNETKEELKFLKRPKKTFFSPNIFNFPSPAKISIKESSYLLRD